MNGGGSEGPGAPARGGIPEPGALLTAFERLVESRRRADEQRAESEAFQRALFREAAVGLALVDADGRFVQVNPAFARIAGYEPGELIGLGRSDLGLEEDRLDVAIRDRQLRTLGRFGPVETRIRRRDGTEVPIRQSGAVVRRGGRDYLLYNVEDISERQAMEMALRESEARFRQAFANAPVGMAMVSPEGTIIDANGAFARLLGHTPQGLVGTRLEDLRLAGGAPDPAGGASDACYRRADGSGIWVRVTDARVRNAAGEVLYHVIHLQDLTAERAAAAQTERHQRELEERVAERTAGLELANSELRAFSYSVSHDLRAPLRSILGFSEVLAETLDPDPASEAGQALGRIRRSARRMEELIAAMLDLSRVSRSELELETVDLSAVAERILAELREIEPGRVVEAEIAPGMVARGDPRLLETALRNLLENAWKYTRGREPARIRFAPAPEGGGWCLEDNGVGFDPRHQDRLFQPFQRLHAGDYEGTGIGLAIVQRVVHRHGGHIRGEGRPGEGARFCFDLG